MGFTFFRDIFTNEESPRIIGVEPLGAPVLTQGRYEYDYADARKTTIRQKMYTLGCEFDPPPIHASGLRYGSRNVTLSALYDKGLFEVVTCSERQSLEAGLRLMRSEAVVPATESAYAVKVAIDEAVKCRESGRGKTILTNLSGNGYFDLLAYEELESGHLAEDGY